ncbi:MAG: JAB domain-containing protein [Sphingobacteriales bacterium]|nr:MAG: JAB domain-containing protein [Sphingobacteriales bacterium]
MYPDLPNPIKQWAEDDRPREKLQSKGPAALSDAELLAILINTGTPRRSALDLGRDVLALAKGNLHELGRLGLQGLCKVKGIGPAKAITLAAALELGRRRQLGEALERPTLKSSEEVAEVVVPLLRDRDTEAFLVLFLNQAQRLIQHEVLSIGGIAGTVADIRVILRAALLSSASRIIVAHNHPSGNLTPSEADKKLTQQLKTAAAHMDITLLDHLIVGGTAYLSFADEGLL